MDYSNLLKGNMSERIIIVGAGGFGREVLWWLQEEFFGTDIGGFLSDDPDILSGKDISVPILGTVDSYEVQEGDLFVIAIGNIAAKKAVSERLIAKGAKFTTFIHNTALVSKTAKIGEGCIIGPYSIVSDHAVISDFVMFSFYASCGHDAVIGKYSILSPYATVNGFVVLGDEVFMGTHSSVAAKRTVGNNSMISSGSAAMYDVPDHCFVVGVPGKSQVIFS